MAPRTAFTGYDLDDDHRLTVTGRSDPFPDSELVFRHIAFQQDGKTVNGAASLGLRIWTAVLDAPTFVPERDALAIGSETYFLLHDDAPLFTTFTWSESVVIGPVKDGP